METNSVKSKNCSSTEDFEPWVIGIHGRKGSGKDYFGSQVADFVETGGGLVGDLISDEIATVLKDLLDEGSTHLAAFADFLKEFLVARGSASIEETTAIRKTGEYRSNLIDTATSLRAQYGEEFFSRALCARLEMTRMKNGTSVFIITDLREKHEKTALLNYSSKTIFFHIHAPKRSGDTFIREAGGNSETLAKHSTHSSEIGLDAETCDIETAKSNGFIWIDNDLK